MLKNLLDTLMHVFELLHELMRPGELGEWHRVDPREEKRLLTRPVPRDSSCYPYHQDLDDAQLVEEDDLLPNPPPPR